MDTPMIDTATAGADATVPKVKDTSESTSDSTNTVRASLRHPHGCSPYKPGTIVIP